MYLSPTTERFLPASGRTFMLIIGPIAILVGLSMHIHLRTSLDPLVPLAVTNSRKM